MKQTLPNAFYSKYSNRLVGHVELNLRNGYVLPLRLDYNTGVLNGFLVFFMELELKGGEFMLFEYFGRYNFNVYLLGTNGTEIDYPHTVHYMQRRLPRAGKNFEQSHFLFRIFNEFDRIL